jgi:hypothetical protein
MSQLPASSSPLPEFPQHPVALQPAYPVEGLNCPIPLYEGELEVEQHSYRARGHGSIRFEWFPSPRLAFCVDGISVEEPFDVGEVVLRLADGRIPDRATVTRIRAANQEVNATQVLSGRLRGPFGQATANSYSHLLFLVPNFQNMVGSVVQYPRVGGERRSISVVRGRIELRACGWRVTLDPIDRPGQVHEELAAQSGYGITHVGKLEREDGLLFTEEQATPFLEGLGGFLSFASGRWTGPLLASGHDSNGLRICELWSGARTTSCRETLGWVDTHHSDHLSDSFPGYMRLWTDPDWNEVIRLATHWYVEANAQAGSVEGGLVLTQTALEMLAWAVVVETEQTLSRSAFRKLTAAKQIRQLISWAGISALIPTSQGELTSLAPTQAWTDAVEAIVEIRNPIIHAERRNRLRFRAFPVGARNEAWNLGLWVLELCLLRLCEYNGTYGCRLAPRYAGEVVPVPWLLYDLQFLFQSNL